MLWPRQFEVYTLRPSLGGKPEDIRTSINAKEAAREYVEDLHLEGDQGLRIYVREPGQGLDAVQSFDAHVEEGNEDVFITERSDP